MLQTQEDSKEESGGSGGGERVVETETPGGRAVPRPSATHQVGSPVRSQQKPALGAAGAAGRGRAPNNGDACSTSDT